VRARVCASLIETEASDFAADGDPLRVHTANYTNKRVCQEEREHIREKVGLTDSTRFLIATSVSVTSSLQPPKEKRANAGCNLAQVITQRKISEQQTKAIGTSGLKT
jgi:hypothetical protein